MAEVEKLVMLPRPRIPESALAAARKRSPELENNRLLAAALHEYGTHRARQDAAINRMLVENLLHYLEVLAEHAEADGQHSLAAAMRLSVEQAEAMRDPKFLSEVWPANGRRGPGVNPAGARSPAGAPRNGRRAVAGRPI